MERVTGRDSPESRHLAELAAEMTIGNGHVGTECDELRGRIRELNNELEAMRTRVQEARATSAQLTSLIGVQRQRFSAPAPMRAELSRRAEVLEEESESLANLFVEGQPQQQQQQDNGQPLALDDWLRRYAQQRVSLHLARRVLSQPM